MSSGLMAWDPGIVLKRHPLPSQPMPKSYASKARELYLEMICASDPRDRTLAATFGVPYEQLEMDRRLLGELQSLQRHLSIDTSRDEERHRRRLEIVAGIAAILHLLFGIESTGLPRRQDADFRRAFLKVVHDWDNGRLGDPNSPKAVVAAAIRLGRLSTDGHPKEQLSYRQMLRLADVFDGWAIAEKSTPSQSARMLGWADRMRQLAEEVGPTWNPPEPELLSLLGFLARRME